MAIQQLKTEILNIIQATESKTRKELSENMIESYVYDKKYIEEWCEFAMAKANIPIEERKHAKAMRAAFNQTIRKEFKRSNEPYHISTPFGKGGVVVTKVSRATGTREAASSKEKRATGEAKNKALRVLELKTGISIGASDRRDIKTAMHGHHGGPNRDDDKTTLGMVGIEEAMPKASRDIESLIDELNQVTPDETLREVVVSSFNDLIHIEMGWSRNPIRVLATRNSRTRNPSTDTYVLDNVITISFALGRGSNFQGAAYTDAMKDWDRGVDNRLTRTINSILDRVERNVNNFVKQHMENHPFDVLAVGGSPSVIDNVITEGPKFIIQNLFPHKARPDMRLKVNKKLFSEMKTPKKGDTGMVRGKKTTKPAKRTARKGLPRVSSGMRTEGRNNPMTLKNLLNEMLPQTVARNMVSPALQYRTGRFANSVRVDNITQGPRGGNTMIEASYMNNPYETFAPGGKMYTAQRDPERLIKRSIRQVATALVGARFGIEIQ